MQGPAKRPGRYGYRRVCPFCMKTRYCDQHLEKRLQMEKQILVAVLARKMMKEDLCNHTYKVEAQVGRGKRERRRSRGNVWDKLPRTIGRVKKKLHLQIKPNSSHSPSTVSNCPPYTRKKKAKGKKRKLTRRHRGTWNPRTPPSTHVKKGQQYIYVESEVASMWINGQDSLAQKYRGGRNGQVHKTLYSWWRTKIA